MLTVAWIAFELDLDHSGQIERAEEMLRRLLECGLVDRLDERTRAPEVGRILTGTAGDEHRSRAAGVRERRIRELGFASAGNELLNHHGIRRYEPARFV